MSQNRGIVAGYTARNPYQIRVTSNLPLTLVLTGDCDEMPSPRLINVTYNKVSQSAERIYKLIEEA